MVVRSQADLRARAMAACALHLGDDELSSASALTPALVESHRGAAARLIAGPAADRGRRVALELSFLTTPASAVDISRRWSRAPSGGLRSPPGLARLVQATALPVFPLAEVSERFRALSRETGVAVTLTRLTTAVMRLGAGGERWAVRLLARGPAQLCLEVEINPRLAPAIVWIGRALAEDQATLEVIAESWPPSLRSALEVALRLAVGEEGLSRAELAVLRARLEEELERDG